MDTEQEAARNEIIQMEQGGRKPPPLPDGMAAVAAEAAEYQHLADEVKEASRRMYLGVADDVHSAPWDAFIVTDRREHMDGGVHYFFKLRVTADGVFPEEFVAIHVFHSLWGDDPQLVELRKGKDAAAPLETIFDAPVDLKEADASVPPIEEVCSASPICAKGSIDHEMRLAKMLESPD